MYKNNLIAKKKQAQSASFFIFKYAYCFIYNEIKPPTGKIFQKYNPIRHYFVMPQK